MVTMIFLHTAVVSLLCVTDATRFISPYEECFIQLNESQVNQKADILQQPACANYSHLIPASNSRTAVKLPESCAIGLANGRYHPLRALPAVRQRCNISGLRARHFDQYINSWDPSAVGAFVDTALRLGYHEVVFIGDSLSIEFGYFLGCDLHRFGYMTNKCAENGIEDHTLYGGCTYVTSKSGLGHLKIRSIRSEPGCMEVPCGPLSIERGVSRTFEPFLDRKVHQLVIFNMGLHLVRLPASAQNISDFATSFLLHAKKLREHNTHLFFRETTSQHFLYSADGSFDQKKAFPLGCCGMPPSPADVSRTDSIFSAALEKADPNWKEFVGWVRFYNTSHVFHSLHTIVGGTTSSDCSHILYVPGISTVLMKEIVASLKNPDRPRFA